MSILFDNVIDVNLLQPLKAFFPIVLTLDGNNIVVKLVQNSKAASLIVSNSELLEKITEYSPEQVNSHINVLGGFYAQYLSSTSTGTT